MFKMLSGSFAIFVLSNHTTCCQTQIGATVPLKKTQGFKKMAFYCAR
jgi:hypothetical protein